MHAVRSRLPKGGADSSESRFFRQREMVEEENKAANLATVVLSNMSTIKAYNLQEHFYSVFADTLEPLARLVRRFYSLLELAKAQ